MFFVYALSSKIQNYVYIGLTKDIDERFRRHNSGREKTTRLHRPYELFFLTSVMDRETARVVEKYLKGGSGKEFLKSMM